MKKRVITILLAVVMLVSLLPVALSAEAATTVTYAQVNTLAKTITDSMDKNGSFPSGDSYAIGSTKVSKAQFLYLASKTIVALNSGKKSGSVTVKAVKNCGNPNGSVKEYNMYKSEYVQLAKNLITYVDNNSTAPNYISCKTVSGQLRFENAIYNFAKILRYYANNSALPNYCTIKNIVKSVTTLTASVGGKFKELSDLGSFAQRASTTTHAQGMAVDGTYVYTALVTTGETTNIVRTNMSNGGGKVKLTYNGKYDLSLGHANDMCAFKYGGYTYLVVSPCKGSSHSLYKKLIVLKVSGTKIVTWKTLSISANSCGVTLTSLDGKIANLLILSGAQMYTAKLNVSTLAAPTLKKSFKININKTFDFFGSTYKNKYNYPSCTTGWFYQGVAYDQKTGKLYVPIGVQNANRCILKSCVLVYDNAKANLSKTGTLSASSSSYSVSASGKNIEVETLDFYGSNTYLCTNYMSSGTFSSGQAKIFKR